MLFVLILAAHPVGARVGAFIAGLSLAVPCFVWAPPLSRGLLMCVMCMPLAAATALVIVPPIAGFRARLAYLCTWCGRHQLNRQARRLDGTSLLRLIVATAVLAGATATVESVSASGLQSFARWFAGVIMVLAFAELATASFPLVSTALGVTVPPLMQSPYRSASVGEFWTKRWNIFASEMVFRPICFAPLARRSRILGLSAAFALSALVHVLLALMALGNWRSSLLFGAFFLVQPLLIIVERRMHVRRWRPMAGRVWALSALTLTSPLFVEPLLRILESSWGIQRNGLGPAIAVLGFVIAFSGFVSLASLVSVSGNNDVNQPAVPRHAGF